MNTTPTPKHFARAAILLFLALPCTPLTHAEIYKWQDADGKTHYSDKKVDDIDAEEIDPTIKNIFGNTPADNERRKKMGFKKDNFSMPWKKSNLPYRFVLSSGIENDGPADSLTSIDITDQQKSLTTYIKLTGVESNTSYDTRTRVIDAKGELLFDKTRTIPVGSSSSVWFAVTITPILTIDTPGLWTFQVLVDDETLLVEKREVRFQTPQPTESRIRKKPRSQR